MDLVIQEKIESSILNGLGYIVRLEKKNGNKTPLCGSFTRKIAQSAKSSETAIFVSSKKIKSFVKSTVTEDKKL